MTVEAVRLASAGAVFWTEAMPDGSAGGRAIAGPAPALDVTLTARLPRGISLRVDGRGLVLVMSPIRYDHAPSQAELQTPPAIPPVTVQGVATARDGRFHPRVFKATPTPPGPAYVALRPSLMATRIGEAGALAIGLQWQDGSPASWSTVLLSCKRNGVTYRFSGQADIAGDALVPLTGLPPLPPAQLSDQVIVTVLADPTQSGALASNPDALLPVPLALSAGFAAQQTITLTRGRITTGHDLGTPQLTLQHP